ncbi:hypothetical protein T261_8344 [Streptomyces lydicus]|nr:hypothetical protein T261_8344 [Streptomyces lydicus]
MNMDKPASPAVDRLPREERRRNVRRAVSLAARASARQEEALAVRQVATALKSAYPWVDAAVVDAVAAAAHATFHQAKIRIYIPILVERRARTVLRAIGREDASQNRALGRRAAAASPPLKRPRP